MPDKSAGVKPVLNKSGAPITDDHLRRLDTILKTPVKSASPAPTGPPPLQASSAPSPSKIQAILSSIPPVKGIGNKMFVFTGRKKIIMDGRQREEEKIKTVDPGKNQKLEAIPKPTPIPEPVPEVKPIPQFSMAKTDDKAKKEATMEAKHQEEEAKKQAEAKKKEAAEDIKKLEEKDRAKPKEVAIPKIETKKIAPREKKEKVAKGGVPAGVLWAAGFVFLIAWTLFWLVFFGYIKL